MGVSIEEFYIILIRAGLTPLIVPGKLIKAWERCWYCDKPATYVHECQKIIINAHATLNKIILEITVKSQELILTNFII